ncbi:MAG: EI24 domain-containing protein [Bacteroidia bacterium]|nr:EI24 domain-containing protein [Winogradskyella sp.]MBT8377371.1 EI24 domain-containing protein [Bacteroidia bacterium]NNF86569.1 EI24 domain-containing protein [Winogradskyella sp.]
MFKHILIGLKAYSGAFSLISKLKLWTYFVVPILISFLVAVFIGLTAYGLSDNIGNFIANIWIWDWGKSTFTTISSIIGALVILVIGLILYKHIIMALSAPFMGPVSEKIEAHLKPLNKKQEASSFQTLLWRGIRINSRNLVMELLLSVPILLLKFIPVINIFSTILLFLVQAYYAGFGNMDYTLERHFTYKESLHYVRQRRGLAIGNGIGFLLLLLIPIIGVLLVLPLSVTAATINTVESLDDER